MMREIRQAVNANIKHWMRVVFAQLVNQAVALPVDCLLFNIIVYNSLSFDCNALAMQLDVGLLLLNADELCVICIWRSVTGCGSEQKCHVLVYLIICSQPQHETIFWVLKYRISPSLLKVSLSSEVLFISFQLTNFVVLNYCRTQN